MTDEEHRQEDEAAGAPGGRAAGTQATAETGDDAAMRAPEAEGDDAADREAAAADGETAPMTSAVPGDTTADRETQQDAEPPGSEPSEEAVASLEDELAEARRAATENLERALRAQAELENVRRRLERDLQNAHKFALERFVSELLPVKDSLELGLAASAEKGASPAGIAQGVELTLRMLEQAMEKFGVAIVDPCRRALRSGVPPGDDHAARATPPSPARCSPSFRRAAFSTSVSCVPPWSSSRSRRARG